MATVEINNANQFNWPIRVYYEDTDSGGVVYHSNYLNFMERARTEWLRHLGFEQTYLKDACNMIFVVHSLHIVFKKPAKLNDLLTITSEFAKIGRGSVEFLQTIHLDKQVLAQAQVKVACVGALTFKPTGLPRQVSLKMQLIVKKEQA